jgi:hypothetical protein
LLFIIPAGLRQWVFYLAGNLTKFSSLLAHLHTGTSAHFLHLSA